MHTYTHKKKHNKSYYENSCIEPLWEDNKALCPWCRLQPQSIVEFSAKDGTIVFYKQCSKCKSVIKVIRKSSEY